MLDEGRLSLSVICMLKQYLTDDNHAELLEGVSRMSYRKAEMWLAERYPQPDTPSIIRKLLDRSRGEPLGGDRYQVEFTASTRLKEKLELAADLMAHRNPSRDWASVIEPALDLLISKLHKERFAETDRRASPRRSRPAKAGTVTNETRRTVLERDGLQCSYVDDEGRRCTARAFLELDHRRPRGKGGGSGTDNVRHLCRAHNQWFAEIEYGREHIERARDAKRRSVQADGAATSRPERANPESTAGGGGATDTS
jgi:5-methylcytosine-specific restriction endonuclease McrA